MIRMSLAACFLVFAVMSTSAHSAGLLGHQYVSLGYQHGEFGDLRDSETMDNTKGVALTYNRPFIDSLDLGLSVEFNKADGKEIIDGTRYDSDFSIGGVVGYAAWFKPLNRTGKYFITPQFGFQKYETEWEGAGQSRNKDETDLFLGLDTGLEFTVNRFVITPAFSVSKADDTSVNAKLGLGFNMTEQLLLTVGGNYQLNENNDYMLSVGFALRF